MWIYDTKRFLATQSKVNLKSPWRPAFVWLAPSYGWRENITINRYNKVVRIHVGLVQDEFTKVVNPRCTRSYPGFMFLIVLPLWYEWLDVCFVLNYSSDNRKWACKNFVPDKGQLYWVWLCCLHCRKSGWMVRCPARRSPKCYILYEIVSGIQKLIVFNHNRWSVRDHRGRYISNLSYLCRWHCYIGPVQIKLKSSTLPSLRLQKRAIQFMQWFDKWNTTVFGIDHQPNKPMAMGGTEIVVKISCMHMGVRLCNNTA